VLSTIVPQLQVSFEKEPYKRDLYSPKKWIRHIELVCSPEWSRWISSSSYRPAAAAISGANPAAGSYSSAGESSCVRETNWAGVRNPHPKSHIYAMAPKEPYTYAQ